MIIRASVMLIRCYPSSILAKVQISSLKKVGVKVSLGDAAAILTGAVFMRSSQTKELGLGREVPSGPGKGH